MAAQEVQIVIDKLNELDEKHGLLIGDLERKELIEVKNTIELMLKLSDRELSAVNVATIRNWRANQ